MQVCRARRRKTACARSLSGSVELDLLCTLRGAGRLSGRGMGGVHFLSAAQRDNLTPGVSTRWAQAGAGFIIRIKNETCAFVVARSQTLRFLWLMFCNSQIPIPSFAALLTQSPCRRNTDMRYGCKCTARVHYTGNTT